MGQNVAQDNEIRFQVILQASDSYDKLNEQLTRVDILNSKINEEHLASLIQHASEVESNLKRSYNYQKLLDQSQELESIVRLTNRLNVTEKFQKAN